MWTTLALAAALAVTPNQADTLSLSNVRTTRAILGLPREGNQFLPGDQVVISFDIEGVKVADDGKVSYGISLEILDNDGKVKFRQAPREMQTVNVLGGNRMPGYAELKIGVQQPPGKYKMKVTVTDQAAKKSQEIVKEIEILPLTFGLVRLHTTGDPEGLAPVPLPAEGQTLWINYAAVGFGRDAKGQPNLVTTLRVLDEDGKPTTAKPLTGVVNGDIPKDVKALPMQFALQLNRAGKFTVEVAATDKLSGKSAALSFPLRVSRVK